MENIEVIQDIVRAKLSNKQVRVERLLGYGSFGFVYSGHTRDSSKTKVVIKFQQNE